jgi:hypothetical protein
MGTVVTATTGTMARRTAKSGSKPGIGIKIGTRSHGVTMEGL